MNLIKKIRLYHAVLAVLTALAYLSGEWGFIHLYLGYGVAAVILFRLLWALSGHRQLGLMKFYPDFEGLNLSNAFTHPAISRTFLFGIAVSVIFTTLIGIAMDGGEALGLAGMDPVTPAYADDHGSEDHENEFLEEIHEFFANLALIFVMFHVGYLLLFKTPLARFMLFLDTPRRKRRD